MWEVTVEQQMRELCHAQSVKVFCSLTFAQDFAHFFLGNFNVFRLICWHENTVVRVGRLWVNVTPWWRTTGIWWTGTRAWSSHRQIVKFRLIWGDRRMRSAMCHRLSSFDFEPFKKLAVNILKQRFLLLDCWPFLYLKKYGVFTTVVT